MTQPVVKIPTNPSRVVPVASNCAVAPCITTVGVLVRANEVSHCELPDADRFLWEGIGLAVHLKHMFVRNTTGKIFFASVTISFCPSGMAGLDGNPAFQNESTKNWTTSSISSWPFGRQLCCQHAPARMVAGSQLESG